MWGRGDSNPYALRHMILSHARLPIPTLPQIGNQLNSGLKINQVNRKLTNDILSAFLDSRRQGISNHTLLFYQSCLSKAIGIELTSEGISTFLSSLSCGNAKHAYFRAIRALYNWLYRQNRLQDNPIHLIDAPILAKKLLPSITPEQVQILIDHADSLRDKCIISLLFDSGLRLNEICTIKPQNLNWDELTVKVTIKGNREAKAAFTPNTAESLKEYLSSNGHNETLFSMKSRGVQDMLDRLSERAGFPCNAHSFRRGGGAASPAISTKEACQHYP